MNLRSCLCAPLLLAFSLPAQEGSAQDPEKQTGPTPQQEVENLRAEKLRLQREIHYAQERVADAKNLLRSKLTRAEQSFRSIEAGVSAASMPAAARQPRRVARVATEEELRQQPEGTMLIVEGRAIAQGFFDKVMDYMREHSAGDDAVRAQRVAFDLIRTEAMAAAFYESEGEARFGDVLGQIQQGKSVAEVAKETGSVPGADPEGRVVVTRNSQYGPFFEQVAFTTEPGTDASPFRNANGYVLMHVDGIEKGATPEQDTAICHVAQVNYADVAEMQRAQLKVNTGQIEVIARDQAALDMLPALFKAAPTAPSLVADRRGMLAQQAKEMEQRIQQLQASGGDQAEITALKQKLEAVKKAMEATPEGVDDGLKTRSIEQEHEKKGEK
ncbi:MAG: peptidyl-prolyl cis-trans isomerase [Planctomycetes bacterium]|nr:peptidyl-prolyl cis-trans isomerase [Planctomycetota bacterium]